ncbi:MAG: hypothetical protein JW989_04985 [Chlorobiaceae bacterium]|nr:hypothetical protein [Chlorobiaceae bacterium]
MSREAHVRFCEHLGGRFPGVTRLPQEKLRELEEELEKMKRDAELGLRVPGGSVSGIPVISGMEGERRKRTEGLLDAGIGCAVLCAIRRWPL